MHVRLVAWVCGSVCGALGRGRTVLNQRAVRAVRTGGGALLVVVVHVWGYWHRQHHFSGRGSRAILLSQRAT